MDLIKLSSVTANETELSLGETINGYTSVTWVERYRDPGDFKIEARLSSGLRDLLPIGSFVTHLNTETVMTVENHNIKQPKDEDPEITISGRCFTSFLENRILGDQALTNEITDYTLASDATWDQAVLLINDHIIDPANVNGRLIGVDVDNTASGTVTTEARTLRPGDVHQAVLDILKVDDLGIRSIRPTPTDPLTYFTIYRGDDISSTVRFSWMRGDLEELEYFYSNKKFKNRAMVMGRWVQATINPTGALNYDQRTMLVDASWIDERQPAYPAGGALALIIAAMQITGDQALKAQTNVAITRADVSENTNLRYRRDYQLGDLVTVDGDFGSSAVMRVIEYAEIEDETGASGHPTLAIPGEF
jgi:hypothetical protein